MRHPTFVGDSKSVLIFCLFRLFLELGEAVGNGLAVLVGRMIVQAGRQYQYAFNLGLSL